jgi:predicted DCC family thiol-disulfide oxidoreductase YuxK
MEITNLPENKKIILFDGVCNLCNGAVNYIIEKDSKDTFRFVALQSEIGQEITNKIGIDTSKTDSIILYEPGKAYYIKAESALKIAKDLKGAISLLSLFNFVPNGIKNSVYDYIAKNRYKWYGKKDACMIPTPELKSKFL